MCVFCNVHSVIYNYAVTPFLVIDFENTLCVFCHVYLVIYNSAASFLLLIDFENTLCVYFVMSTQ